MFNILIKTKQHGSPHYLVSVILGRGVCGVAEATHDMHVAHVGPRVCVWVGKRCIYYYTIIAISSCLLKYLHVSYPLLISLYFNILDKKRLQ